MSTDDCDKRNYQRLKNHFYCYATCGFIPHKLLPEKGWEVGISMLIPSTLKMYEKEFEYTGDIHLFQHKKA